MSHYYRTCHVCAKSPCCCSTPITVDYNHSCGCKGSCGCAKTCDMKCDNTHNHYGKNVHFCKELSEDCNYGFLKKGMDYDTIVINMLKKIEKLEKAYGSLVRKLNVQEAEIGLQPFTYTIKVGDPLPVNSSTVTLKKYDITLEKDNSGMVVKEYVYNGLTWIKTLG